MIPSLMQFRTEMAAINIFRVCFVVCVLFGAWPPMAVNAHRLPPNVESLHNECLVGPFIVQLQHAWDIMRTHEERTTAAPPQSASAKRMLKLKLADGFQQIYAMEYARIDQLSASSPPGTILVIHNVIVRRGLLQLTPACCRVGPVQQRQQQQQQQQQQ